MNLNNIDEYIKSKSNCWAATTIKNERAKLNAVCKHITDNPIDLYNYLINKNYKKYSIKVIFQRVADFYLFTNKDMLYKDWIKSNANLFKHVYNRKKLKIDYKEAIKRINTLPQKDIRDKALQIISSGMRWSESFTLDMDCLIKGKGGKYRKVYFPSSSLKNVSYNKSYSRFYRALKQIELTPHMLRKLAATKFADFGMNEADLLDVFGWSNIDTAKYYLQGKSDDDKLSIIREAFNG
ncbi:MAG: tyrosine-type recombinase/integrase [Candidatus Aenigmarchaeota archaeon]|nr:tyrosine-type recombinase/integrase [Candidatus Aenigmarchaeota archaeon]